MTPPFGENGGAPIAPVRDLGLTPLIWQKPGDATMYNVYALSFYAVLQVVVGPAVCWPGDHHVHPDGHYCHLHRPVP